MRWLIPLIGHLAILALLMIVMKNDEWVRTNMYDFRAILPYSLVILDGVWAALSAGRKSYRSLGIAMVFWLVGTVWMLYLVTTNDLSHTRGVRSEGGEFYILIASVLVIFLIMAGFGIGRLLQFLAAWSARSGKREAIPDEPDHMI
jgi:hypothetical protein